MEELYKQIYNAFSDIEKPVYTLCNAVIDDDYGNLERVFDENEKHWGEIPLSHIEEGTAAFYFLPPESILYYLPAYMCACIQNYGQIKSDSFQHLSYFLSGMISEKIIDLQLLMTENQKKAVQAFLRYMSLIEEKNLKDEGHLYNMQYDKSENTFQVALETIWG